MQVVIVDDNTTSLAVLTRLIAALPECEARGFADPRMALEEITSMQVDLVVVDYQMPEMDGVSVLRALRANLATQHVPVVMITADLDQSLRLEAVEAGATDFLTKPVNPVELRARVGNLLALRMAQNALSDRARSLEQDVAAATQHLLEREEELIYRLSQAIEFRDGETGEHVGRVADIARIIASELGMSGQELRNIWLAAPLHDIGKIGVADAILNKPGRLTPDEVQAMRKHVEYGRAILRDSQTDLVRMAAEIAGSHHEKWDGSGYPVGLSGKDIPLSARVVAIADVFDALCSIRPYKAAWTAEQARAEIVRSAGTHFDPDCVAAFERGWDRVLTILNPAATEAAA